MDAVLYAIPASHPCAAVGRALELKGIPFRRVELIPAVHRVEVRLRLGAPTVPAIRFADGERMCGSREIMRALDERVPEPPLLPRGDEEARASALRAEEWGDEVLQSLARRVIWAALRRAPGHVMGYTAGADLPVPRPVARLSAPLVARLAARLNRASDANVRADLLALPAHLDRVDRWIRAGVLPVDPPGAATLQIGAGVRLLLTVGDVREAIDARPAGAMARAAFPDYPGATPTGVLPRAWLEGLR